MSAYVFPSLVGQAMEVSREPVYPITVYTSKGGKEDVTLWSPTPRWRYKVKLNVLRSYVNMVGAWGTLSEIAVVQWFISTHYGSWDAFHFIDPYDSSDRLVRFVEGSNPTVRVVNGVWQGSLDLIERL